MLLAILTEKKLLEHFTKKNYKKRIHENFEWKNVINYMFSEKATIVPSSVALIKQTKSK